MNPGPRGAPAVRFTGMPPIFVRTGGSGTLEGTEDKKEHYEFFRLVQPNAGGANFALPAPDSAQKFGDAHSARHPARQEMDCWFATACLLAGQLRDCRSAAHCPGNEAARSVLRCWGKCRFLLAVRSHTDRFREGVCLRACARQCRLSPGTSETERHYERFSARTGGLRSDRQVVLRGGRLGIDGPPAVRWCT